MKRRKPISIAKAAWLAMGGDYEVEWAMKCSAAVIRGCGLATAALLSEPVLDYARCVGTPCWNFDEHKISE